MISRNPPARKVKAVVERHASAFEVPAWRIMLVGRHVVGNRMREVVLARWAAWYALALEGYSLHSIAPHFGTDHASILYGIKRLRGAPPHTRPQRKDYRARKRGTVSTLTTSTLRA